MHIIFSIAWFVLLIPVVVAAINSNMMFLLYGYFSGLPALNLAILIPQSKRERRAMMPSQISMDDEYIEYTSHRTKEYRRISDVKVVRDYGDFYDVIFPVGKISDFYVCQKDLLTQGTLQEFEKLFEGKVVRMAKPTK